MESDPRILKERGDNEAIREAARAAVAGGSREGGSYSGCVAQRCTSLM